MHKEKPIKQLKFALTGLYYFDNQAKNFAKSLKNKKGEYEITSLCEMYLNEKCLSYEKLGRVSHGLMLGHMTVY